jgi:hypothetical protein
MRLATFQCTTALPAWHTLARRGLDGEARANQLQVPLTHDEPAPQSPSDEHGEPVLFA